MVMQLVACVELSRKTKFCLSSANLVKIREKNNGLRKNQPCYAPLNVFLSRFLFFLQCHAKNVALFFSNFASLKI